MIPIPTALAWRLAAVAAVALAVTVTLARIYGAGERAGAAAAVTTINRQNEDARHAAQDGAASADDCLALGRVWNPARGVCARARGGD